jgi:hypothetical protein
MMVRFVKKSIRRYLGTFLWANLAVWLVAGILLAAIMIDEGALYTGSGITVTALTVLLCIALGLVSTILVGGYVEAVLNIEDNIEKLVNKGVAEKTGEAGDTPPGLGK